MNRKLIINGNEVYEIDEDCMLKRRLDTEDGKRREIPGNGCDSSQQAQKRRE